MTRIFLQSLGVVNALGRGKAEVAARLFAGDVSGIVLEEGWLPDKPVWVGRVSGELPEMPHAFAADASRNNRLLLAALEEIRPETDALIQRYGRDRVAVVLGTSTSGFSDGEAATRWRRDHGTWPPRFHYRQREIGRMAPFLAEYLDLDGPALTVSTACTSSGRAFATARNLMRCGLCDAAIVGGCDTLCGLTIGGFTALESIASDLCNPMSLNRKGITIGEGAALFLVTSQPSPVELLGIGASSDAHHLSAPAPDGLGAIQAMDMALRDANVRPEAVDYVNLHATATIKNDEMESKAVAEIFRRAVPCGGTKPLTGHALGASAATELALCWLTLHPDWNPSRWLPPHVWDGVPDPALPPLNFVKVGDRMPSGRRTMAMSNSFAFGGNNLSLVIAGEQP